MLQDVPDSILIAQRPRALVVHNSFSVFSPSSWVPTIFAEGTAAPAAENVKRHEQIPGRRWFFGLNRFGFRNFGLFHGRCLRTLR
jgi:hypothetical protein